MTRRPTKHGRSAALLLVLLVSPSMATAQMRNIENGADTMGIVDALTFSTEASAWFCSFAGGCDEETRKAMEDGERTLETHGFGIARNDAYRWFPGCVISTLRRLGGDAKKIAVFDDASECFAQLARDEWER